jgi:acyl-CoA reductase-like NAD-dependent aldehyde dehydrogenase
VAVALAAGCSAVLKPSENTPLNTLRLGRICAAAGIPDGVFNIVNGFGDTAGSALINHPRVDKISFTGSTAVGRKLIVASAGNLKRLTLELGGKSPVIVMDDADLEQAVLGVRTGIFTNSGQQCLAGSRAYIQRGIYDRLLDRLAAVAGGLKVGNGMDPEVQIGPLISQRQFDRVMGYIERGVTDGGRLVTGGHRVGEAGYFVAPTILAGLDQTSAAMRDEIFGPVLCVVPFDDPEDAIRLANDTTYGLAGAIYTRDISKAHKLAKRLSTGNVYINCHGIMDFAVPFGGYRGSGWQRQSGEEGLGAFLETKSVFALL